MKFRAILAAAVVLAMATSAQAISLVVMATNTTAVPGEKVFTIGVKVTAADVAAAGPNSNAVLVVQNVTFTGGAGGPIDLNRFIEQARRPKCANERPGRVG